MRQFALLPARHDHWLALFVHGTGGGDEVRGLDSKATDRMLAAWRLLAGETYNSDYPRQFLDSISGQYPADQWKITVHETPEDQDKTVDVSLHFDPRR